MSAAKKPAYITFATNLRNAMNRKGYNQAMLVSRASTYAPKSHPISRSNISEYCGGKKMPGPVRLNAIAKALEVEVHDLVPITAPRTRTALPHPAGGSFEMIDVGNGQVRMIFDRTMPMMKATEILSVLNSIDKARGYK